MAIAPIRPLQTVSLLGLVLSKIRRTPRARLGLVYRLVPLAGCPPRTVRCGCTGRIVGPSHRDLRLEICRQGNIAERPVAQTLLVERLALGDIIGTPLVIGGCPESTLVAGPDEPGVDLWA